MALQPLHIDIVKTPGVRALPGSLKVGSGLGKGAFQALFTKSLDLTGDSGLLSRIASLLQQGVPMATITNGIAAKLSGALARAAGEPADARARSTLQRALSKALAPPGSGPPQGTPAQQAAALEQRVKDLLAKLTDAAPTATATNAGQKSEFSGNILDAAKTAKDIPARQKSTTSPVEFSTDDIAALAHSLLQTAATAAQGAPPLPLPAAKPPAQPAATVAALQKAPTPNPPASGDLLTRMVARAVNAAGERTGTTGQQAQTPSSGPGSQPAAAAVFARLIAAAGQNTGSQTGGYGADAQTPGQPKEAPVPSAPRTSGDPVPISVQNAAPASSPAFTGHLAAAQTQTAGTAYGYSTVDPNAVVEQVLKGITIRKSGESSEIRLRLQPDSLGDVSLKLTVTGNSIAANVVAQNAHVRDILLANQQQLARSLADAGLSLGNFSVDVSGGNAGFTGGGSQQQQQRFAGSRPGAFGAVLAAEDDSWGDNRFGPPVFGGSKALVLNYLA